MIYEIRDYHYRPDIIDKYKTWAEAAVVVLRDKLDVVGFWIDEGQHVPEITGSEARQNVVLRSGIESELARNLVKTIKKSKIKVQAAIQGDKLRVSGKKRDDLQATIRLLKEAEVDLPLQYENFRD